MKRLPFRFQSLFFLLLFIVLKSNPAGGAEPKVQILSPKDGSQLTQEQNAVLVSGKVTSQTARSSNVDILFVIDVSGSTLQYAGVDFGELSKLPDSSGGFGMPQISIFGGGIQMGQPPLRNLRNSVLAAEVAAARRLLLQLDPQTTRVGVATFGQGARAIQPLTHDYDQVRRALEDILRAGPAGGTNMAEGIRTGITELLGLGMSEKRTDAVKVQILLTDGFPTMPIGGGKRATPEDTHLAINAARLSGKAGIKVHVFALGEEALQYPRAAVGIAQESGGTYTPVSRPADVLAVVENISVVGVDYVQIVNQTTGQKASQVRLAADGYFSSAVPVIEGRNQIDVFARASDGSSGRDSTTVYYQSGTRKSLELEVFLEKEKNLKLEVERLGKTQAEIQQNVEQGRENSIGRSQRQPPPSEGPPR
ncbi:MAG TPA: vWA domain-containing protein [Candidatus Binatia bacterium]|nr:vWA domain-containing protein [Candidatus Binatia bacterium]